MWRELRFLYVQALRGAKAMADDKVRAFDKIAEGLNETLDISRGEAEPARIHYGWVDRPWEPLPVTELPERLTIDFYTGCNLRCPMCPVWGQTEEDINSVRGMMNKEKAAKLIDEISAAKPLVQPNMYGEPLLLPDLKEKITHMKAQGIAIAFNTNGLTLTDELAKFFVDNSLDSISFSIDAVTPETLRKIRGIDKLEKIEAAVFRMLRARGERSLPRISVSFTKQDDNRHEEEAFIERWVGAVDCVRVNLVFLDGTFPDMEVPEKRLPCPAIYKTMPIHNDGTVTVCCLDGLKQTNMGNVFETSVKEVWHGEGFSKARFYHETGQWDKVPFCTKCNGWAQYSFTDEVKDGIFIRRSPEFTYYNLISRLDNWQGRLLGGHNEPPANLLA
jgi:MoaA/NifB/PqqE/SkfB family radical SAM enzyme